MTVSDLVNKLTVEEFMGWVDFFNRRPPGWRDDYRAGVLIQGMSLNKPPDITKIFPSLKVLEKEHSRNATPMRNFKDSALASFIMSAKGGAAPNHLFQE